MILTLILILLVIGGGIWGWPLIAAAIGLSGVTDKSSALKHIRQLMNTYDIVPAEVEAAFHGPGYADDQVSRRSRGDVAKTLFTYLGAIFILAGVGTYISAFWDTMGAVMRVLVTLGVGYVLFILLVAALYEDRFPRLVTWLTFASAFIMTGGWYVLLDELFPGISSRNATLIVCGVMALQLGALFARYRLTVLAFTALVFGYAFMHVGLEILGVGISYIAIVLGASLFLVGVALENTSHRVLSELALLIGVSWLNGGLFDRVAMFTSGTWAGLLIGVNLILTGYGMHRAGRYPRLIALGYLVGSVMGYAALFELLQGTSLELLYLAVTASALYACVVLESRTLLLTTVLAMLGFIGYFSARHFADSLGWPITLVVMGVAFLGVGTIALRVKQRLQPR